MNFELPAGETTDWPLAHALLWIASRRIDLIDMVWSAEFESSTALISFFLDEELGLGYRYQLAFRRLGQKASAGEIIVTGKQVTSSSGINKNAETATPHAIANDLWPHLHLILAASGGDKIRLGDLSETEFVDVTIPRVALLRYWEAARPPKISDAELKREFDTFRATFPSDLPPSLPEEYNHLRQFGASRDRVEALRKSAPKLKRGQKSGRSRT